MRMSHTHLHHSILHAADHDSSVICYCRTIVYIHHTSIIYVCTNLFQYDRERLSLSLYTYICIQDTYSYVQIYVYIYKYPRCYMYNYVNTRYSNHPSSSMHKKPYKLAHFTL